MQLKSEEIQTRKPVKQRTGEILVEMGLITASAARRGSR